MPIRVSSPADNVIRIAMQSNNIKPHQFTNLVRQVESTLNIADSRRHILIDARESQVSPNYVITLLLQSGLVSHPRLGCIAVVGAGFMARLFGRLNSPEQVRYFREEQKALSWFERCLAQE